MTLKHEWTGTSGNTYQLYTSLLTWDEANAFAQSIGGYLAKVDTAAENTEIFNHVISVLTQEEISQSVSSNGGDGSYAWLGGSDAENEGTWVWSADGSVFDYSYDTTRSEWADSGTWGNKEPDGDIYQNYLAMGLSVWPNPGGGIGVPGEWNDIDYYAVDNYDSDVSRLYSVVEFDAVQASEEVYEGISYTLSVIVDAGILDSGPVLLTGLSELISESGSHTIEYNGLRLNYSDIDALITTVIRDNEFTDEFAAEIEESFPLHAGISYTAAIDLVGQSAIGNVLMTVAGADGDYVG